jgi:5'-deoxynucleotidase YfbR-like HD superfamily hydrolase
VNQQPITTGIQPVTPSTLRQIWSVIEETHASLVLKLSDADLLQQLLIQLADKKQLNVEEVCEVRAYIYSRIPLIRDDAQARLVYK